MSLIDQAAINLSSVVYSVSMDSTAIWKYAYPLLLVLIANKRSTSKILKVSHLVYKWIWIRNCSELILDKKVSYLNF
ncbi:hypothetical protein Trydic_g971 [Trypoxylus dichotomus]